MKSSEFILKIEKPCTENWSSMTLNDAGKFCSNCQKNVIDFSTCSDDEIIRILEKLDGKICGRLTKKQLERVFVATQNRKVSPHLNKILVGLFALGMLETSNLNAQKTTTDQTVQQNVVSATDTTGIHNRLSKKQVMAKDTVKNIVSGKVLNIETNLPVQVNIHVQNNPVYVMTDSLGNFTLQVPDSLLKDSLILEVTFPYYVESQTKITKTNLHDPITIYVREEQMIMGEMIASPNPPKKEKKKSKK